MRLASEERAFRLGPLRSLEPHEAAVPQNAEGFLIHPCAVRASLLGGAAEALLSRRVPSTCGPPEAAGPSRHDWS